MAEAGKLVTFGIVPTEAHTGYGYIETGDEFEVGFEVNSFKEKPDLKTAQSYLENGGYLWNSGMFLFRASRYLDELNSGLKCSVCSKAMAGAGQDLDFAASQKKSLLSVQMSRSIMLCLKIRPMLSLFRWMLAGTILVPGPRFGM